MLAWLLPDGKAFALFVKSISGAKMRAFQPTKIVLSLL
jgi:hypothetical protein